MPIISPKYNYVYFANPKTGSTSLRDILIKTSTDYLHEFNTNHFHFHMTLSTLKSKYDITNYFTFTTIRNPYEKLVSLYFYNKPDINNLAWYDEGYDKNTKFANNFKIWLIDYLNDKNENRLWSMRLPNTKIETYAFDNNFNQVITKIYKIENLTLKELENDINKHNQIILKQNNELINKINFNIKMPYLNVTQHKHYSEYYDIELIELVKKHYAYDIKIGNYKFIRVGYKKYLYYFVNFMYYIWNNLSIFRSCFFNIFNHSC
jgi:hypothetical protein